MLLFFSASSNFARWRLTCLWYFSLSNDFVEDDNDFNIVLEQSVFFPFGTVDLVLHVLVKTFCHWPHEAKGVSHMTVVNVCEQG